MAHEHFDSLEELMEEFQKQLDGIKGGDQAAIDKVVADFQEAALGAGLELKQKVEIVPQKGGRLRLVLV